MKCELCAKETSNQKFCSRACSAKVSNWKSPKRKLVAHFCKKCGIELPRNSWTDRKTLCDPCNPQIVDFNRLTYGEVYGKRKYQKNSRIRGWARQAYLSSSRPQKCFNCEYEKHFEVCHIKSISSFPDEALIAEINKIENLIALCRNCHWELDHDLLHLAFPEFEELHS